MTGVTKFELSDKQVEQRDAAASAARHVMAFGGSRSGKTFGFVRCVAARALMAPRSRHLVARLHNVDVRQAVLMDTWPAVMGLAFPGVPYETNKSDQYVTFGNDAEVWFGGLDDKERVDKILGKEYATIYVNECSQVAYATVLTLRTRLAQSATKVDGKPLPLKMYYDLNPVGKGHWSYKEFVKQVRPDNGMPVDPDTRASVQMNPIDNPHLDPAYIQELMALPSRQRQRFFSGEYLSEVPGSLWPLDTLDATRVASHPQLTRVVVAVDPSGGDDAGNASQGIVVVGLGVDGHVYVLEDLTCSATPAGWARVVGRAYRRHQADCVVAEGNYGGAMVKSNILTEDPGIPVKMVTASRGKHVRAEPVAALYEDRPDRPARAHHVGTFPELEDQMSSFTADGYEGAGSPDRADALVWGVTELTLRRQSKTSTKRVAGLV